MPALFDLSLDEDVQQRADENDYKLVDNGVESVWLSNRYNYEICAEFTTDTVIESPRSSYSYSDYSFNHYDKGRY